jgi:hypothetical protein
MNFGNQHPQQRMKLAPNAYHSNSTTNNNGAHPNSNSYYKSQMIRIYCTDTPEEPQWVVKEKERQRDPDPDAGSPRSCDNTINTNSESKYDDEELEAALGEYYHCYFLVYVSLWTLLVILDH